MFSCPNCGFVHGMGPMCPNCGFNNAQMAFKMQQNAIRERRMWRILFVVLELASFFIALFLCWLFAKVLDTDIFERQSYWILLFWVFLAYKIYSWFRLKIR